MDAHADEDRLPLCAARAGFGDLLIGAGAMMIEANGLDPDRHGHIRDAMVDLIKIVEGFYACGVAASVYGTRDPSGAVMPEVVFSNIGKLLLSTQIYDMHRIAHYVSGGLIVALPGPDEDHNPETAASLSAVLAGRAAVVCPAGFADAAVPAAIPASAESACAPPARAASKRSCPVEREGPLARTQRARRPSRWLYSSIRSSSATPICTLESVPTPKRPSAR
jgi:hypothetical protein